MPDDLPPEMNLELIQQLCLEAGSIMEEVSADMALSLPRSAEIIKARVDVLHKAAGDITALATAARALVR